MENSLITGITGQDGSYLIDLFLENAALAHGLPPPRISALMFIIHPAAPSIAVTVQVRMIFTRSQMLPGDATHIRWGAEFTSQNRRADKNLLAHQC
jgi:hypothetical protein